MPLEFLELCSDLSNGYNSICARDIPCQQHAVFVDNFTLLEAIPELGNLFGGGLVASPLVVAGVIAELDGVEDRDLEAEGLEDKSGDRVAYVAENYLYDGSAGARIMKHQKC